MTPKEKAERLVSKFIKWSLANDELSPKQTAKQCALIAVDEVEGFLLAGIDKDPRMWTFYQNEAYKFWKEARKEIERL